jgi:hypothetical protein
MSLSRACVFAAALALAGGCGSHPAGPSTLSIASVSAEGASWATTAQAVTVTGTGFDAAMAISVTGPLNTSAPHTLTYSALNLKPSSFQVSAFLPSDGTFNITLTPATGAAVTRSFTIVERSLACGTPLKLDPKFDPTYGFLPVISASLVDQTTATATLARLTSQYKFTPQSVSSSTGRFTASAADTLVDALRCDPAIKTLSYNNVGCFIPEGCVP